MTITRPKSILGRILLAALLPIGLLAVLLSSYLINARLVDLQSAFAGRGNAQAKQLASLAVVGLFTGDNAMLQGACERVLSSNSDVQRVLIYDHSNNLVAQSERAGEPAESTTWFRASVIPPAMEIDDKSRDSKVPPLGEVTIFFSTRAAAEARQQVLRNSLIITLLSFALAVLLTIIVTRQIVRPIQTLRDAVSRVQGGDLEARVSEISPGELGELQNGFNAMAEQISASETYLRRQVERATEELRLTMHDLEQKNLDLDLARHREQEANRAKSAFLANMSHEIRTPMNGVLGFAGLLQKTGLDNPQREFLDTIIRSANNLLAIINDILDFSEMEAGSLTLERVSFDPRDAIEDVVGLLIPQAQQKHLDLIQVVEPDIPARLLGDVTRLRHVVTNLMSNAVKFTDDGEVIVHVCGGRRDDDRYQLTVSVSDTGIGISAEVIAGLFQPFSQGPSSTRRLYGGTGLGLSICRSIVDAMDGEIEVDSEEGQGSTFTVRLPFDIEAEAEQVEGMLESAPAARRGTALIVDRHPLSALALKYLLWKLGFDVERCVGPEAIDDTARPSLWLLRYGQIPSANEIKGDLQRIPQAIAEPIVLLVPSVDRHLQRAAATRGNCHLLSYPGRTQQLVLAIEQILTNSGRPPLVQSTVDLASDEWLSGKTVMIADDNAINLQLMDTLLRSYGAHTLLAHDGEEAQQLAEQTPVDLLLLDLHMPGKSGLAVAHALREQVQYKDAPILALTADVRMQAELVARGDVFDECLVKPLREKTLREALQRIAQSTQFAVAEPALAESMSADLLPVRDRQQAVEISAGSREVADELLQKLRVQAADNLREIREQHAREDWERLWHSVHRFHGAAKACAMPALSSALQALQDAVASRLTLETALKIDSLATEVERLELYREPSEPRGF